jgi:hypothetical protein
LGSNNIWIIVSAIAVVVLGGLFFMSNNEEAEGVMGKPAVIEEMDTDEDQ